MGVKDQHSGKSFLTDVAPLPHQPACVVITHKNFFHRQHFQDGKSPLNFTGEIKHFKVHKLIPGWSDEELFALGTKSVEDAMRLVSITTPGPKNKVVVTEITKLDNFYQHHELTVALPEAGSTVNGAKFIIIASIGPDRLQRRLVYRVNISPKT